MNKEDPLNHSRVFLSNGQHQLSAMTRQSYQKNH